jgi:phage terminase large subunit-like protein
LPRAERAQFIHGLIERGELDDEEALLVEYAWEALWARANQLEPEGDWRFWLLLAGRGFGKTRTIAEWVRCQAERGLGPGAIVGRTAADVRDVIVEGPAGIIASSPPYFRPVYEPSKRRLTWPNGIRATTFSAEEPDQLRGPQHSWAVCDELAAWAYLADTWSNLQMGLRLGDRPRCVIATTPRPLPLLRELLRDKRVAVTRGRTYDNAANLSADAIEDLQKRYEGTRLGRQELEGEILDDVPGALWTRAMLQEALERGKPYAGVWERVRDMFSRVVVAVDPSGSPDSERGDEIGIVAAGRLKHSDEAVLLQDATMRDRPEVWAGKVQAVAERWDADAIVAEGNYGGDMVRATIQAAGGGRPVRIITASRGKAQRAEPVSLLYEQGRVHHARGFSQLEDELCFFTPNGYQGDASPNRADAAIWAVTELMLGPRHEPRIRRL